MTKRRILIAGDNEDFLNSLMMIFENEGYEAESTNDGNWLLRTDLQLPDLFLLGSQLSNADGREICMKLKRNKETKDIPVIMFSEIAGMEESAIQAGADDFLSKPFTEIQLMSKVEKLTGAGNKIDTLIID